MRDRVREIVALRRALAAIEEVDAAEVRAAQAERHVHSELYFARKEAFNILAGCGDAALPILRMLLGDESNGRLYGDIIDAMGSAGGAQLGPEFIKIVDEELQFWRARAPSLEKGWWNGKGVEPPEVRLLRERYTKVLHVFRELRKMRLRDSRSAVQEFRRYWRSLPQLEDQSGLDQMSQACDAVLKALDGTN